MSDELLNSFLPGVLQHLLFTHDLQLIHHSVHILDQDVITCNQNLLLRSLTLATVLSCALGCWLLLVAWLLGRAGDCVTACLRPVLAVVVLS